MHRKAAQNNKRAKTITKFARAISIAAKLGGSTDPETNSKLKYALKAAQTAGVPKDVVKRALEKTQEKDNLEEITYEGYGPGGIAILVEAITDNRAKTAPEIRATFAKYGGTMSEPNTVAFMFSKMGLIECEMPESDYEEFFMHAAELDALEICDNQAFFRPESLQKAHETLEQKWQVITSEICFIPQNLIEAEQSESITKLINALEENESVQACWHNLKE